MAGKGKTNSQRVQKEAEIQKIDELAARGTRSISEIVAHLSSDIWDVRKKASEALISFGEDVIPYITSNLKSHYFQDEDLLYWSIQTLGGLGEDTAASVLLEWMKDPSFPKNHRVFIVQAIGQNRPTRAIEPLIQALCDDSFEVQSAAAEVLKSYGKKVIPPLQAAFASDRVEIRTWVSRILGQLLGRDAMTFFRNMLASEKRELRYYAVSALEEIGDQESLDLILSRLTDSSFLVRVQVEDILKRRGEAILPSLLKMLQTGGTDEKYQAARLLYMLMGDAAVHILRERIGTHDLESKLLILSALAEAGGEAVVQHLVDAFHDPNWLVQKHAANLLCRIGPSVIEPVRQMYIRTDRGDVRGWLVTVLAYFKEKSLATSKELFADLHRRDKIRMLEALRDVDGPRVMYFLIRALGDVNWTVRNLAFEMLKNFKDKSMPYEGEETLLGELLMEVKARGLEDENSIVQRMIDAANQLDVYRRRASDRDPGGRSHHEVDSKDSTEYVVTGESGRPDVVKPFRSILFQNQGEQYTLSIDDLLRRAIELGASDIHISAGYPPVFRVKGAMARQELPVLSEANTKYLTTQVVNETLRHEFEVHKELDLSYEIPEVSRFRLNVFQEVTGIGLVFRVIPTRIPELHEIGAPAILKEMCERRKGLILVTGPTGSGKSTTLAALIHYINQARREHIITIEDPVEFLHKPLLSKITQREVKVSTHSFSGALRAALREDPNIILVGEMRDLETIELAIVAAETGHLVFGTVHTSSAGSTIDRIIDAFPHGKHEQIRTALVEGLYGVVAQTLVPRKDESGLVAAFEIMLMTPAIGNLIREGKTNQIRDYILQGKQKGMMLLDDSLADLIKSGTISYDDALAASYDKDAFRKRYGESAGGRTGRTMNDPLSDPFDGLQPKKPAGRR